jgi:hypothetical protein
MTVRRKLEYMGYVPKRAVGEPERSEGSRPSFEGRKASELDLRPGDWNDPAYQEAYTKGMIFRNDWDRDFREAEEMGAFVIIERAAIRPGNHSERLLERLLEKLVREKKITIFAPYDGNFGRAVIDADGETLKELSKRGFEVEIVDR